MAAREGEEERQRKRSAGEVAREGEDDIIV